MLAFQDPLGQLPVAASTFTDDVDGVYYLCLWICIFFFFLILGVLAVAVVKFRRRTPDQPPASMVTHNTPLEVIWTLIPLVIVMVLFAWGWKGSLDMTMAPADALQYQAVGQQWEWQITHPGSKSPAIGEMWVPIDTPVKVILHSNDVLHSFYVPAFRAKRDVLPGRYQMVWFKATKLGDYHLMCAEYCGTNHSYMLGTVHVVSQEEFDTRPWDKMPTDPLELGKWTFDRRCVSCHTIDGNRLIGPSFKGLWGKTETFEDGTSAVVDEAYVKESIHTPQQKIVQGYPPTMTPFPDLTDEQIAGIIEFMKSLQ